MAVTQNFYPTFFQKSLKGTSDTNFDPSGNTLACTMTLFSGSGGDFDPSHSLSGSLSGALSGSGKPCSVTMSLDSDTLKFSVPNVTWATSPGTFTDAVLSTTTGGHLFMHFDMGATITPSGQFTLVMTSGQEPRIDLVP
jgi:hypothetical protein